MTDLSTVRPAEDRAVRATATDPAGLVVAFLNQLLLLSEREGFVGRVMHVETVGEPPTSARGTVRGEPFDPSRHPSRTEVKAITLHRLRFDPAAGRARVIVDI